MKHSKTQHLVASIGIIAAITTSTVFAADSSNAPAAANSAHTARMSVEAKVAPSDADNRICVKSDIKSYVTITWTTGKIFSKGYFDTPLPTSKDTPGFDGIPRNCVCYKSPKVYDDNWSVAFQKKGNVSDLQVKESLKFDMGKAKQKKSVLVVFNNDEAVSVLQDQGCDFKPITIGGK